ncbi:hypothetical protein QCA50_003834 [Cerrena zonata]|uniref:CRAL-TRIO domain-containing protein n=1 Tax=Cerrena zonata TaxID=2478898 RepID=A0AAW0GMA2_9APHY
MSISSVLQEYVENLQKVYEENLAAVKALQQTLTDEILPGLIDELELGDERLKEAEDWLSDTQSIFRTLKVIRNFTAFVPCTCRVETRYLQRHKFTTSFALEALRTTLIWRMRSLPPLNSVPPSPFLRCLPTNCRDPFDRPILVVQLSGLSENTEDLRAVLLRNTERLRFHLSMLNASRGTSPILQYVALLDIKGVSLSSLAKFDLLAWFMSELLPHYPGLLTAVFILNYSWVHSGLWNLSKRTLPKAALSRVFFPTHDELLEYFTPSSLPQEYGGNLPSLSDLPDPLYNDSVDIQADIRLLHQPPLQVPADQGATTTQKAMAPHSLQNPYYGYPVTISSTAAASTTPMVYHVRRRKRDLIRTLMRLFWMRWRKPMITSLLCLVLFLTVAGLRKIAWVRRWRWPISSASALLGLILQLPPTVGVLSPAIPVN